MTCGVGCVEASSACVEVLELIFQIGFGCGIFGFLVDFGRFWEAKMEAKIDFWVVFFRYFLGLRFGIDFGWIFGGSELEKSIKTIGFSMVFVDFQKIDVFEKSAKKLQFWSRFRRAKPSKIKKK